MPRKKPNPAARKRRARLKAKMTAQPRRVRHLMPPPLSATQKLALQAQETLAEQQAAQTFLPGRLLKDPDRVTQDIMERLFNTGSLTRADRQALVVIETTPGFGADPRFAEMIKHVEKAFSDG